MDNITNFVTAWSLIFFGVELVSHSAKTYKNIAKFKRRITRGQKIQIQMLTHFLLAAAVICSLQANYK